MRFAYPVELTPEPDGSAVNVAIPDVPGALTYGADEADALMAAEDCLIAALREYVKLRRPLPMPGPARGRPLVGLPSLVTAKLALHTAMRDAGISNVELAQRLGVSEGAVRKLLDLDHRSHIGQIEAALGRLGLRLEVTTRRAA